jgi:protein O-mannosyl-transferase
MKAATDNPQSAAARTLVTWALPALLLAAGLAAYWPSLGGALLWDDDAHVTREALRPLSGLARIWFQPGATQQYYPVLHSAFWVEYRLWGGSVLGYHLANLGEHLLAAYLLYRILVLLRVPGAAVGALAFALHPVCVESVAWISEQKNTLSTVFYMASVLLYLRFVEARRAGLYAGALVCFVLALLSKSVTASLPAALLVVLWARGKLSRASAVPVLPWFALSAAAAVVTPWVERTYIGASGHAFALGPVERVLIAGRALCFYVSKLVWPSELVFVYPRWEVSRHQAVQYIYPAVVLLVLGVLAWHARRQRQPLGAALLFAGTLFPALGFINVYPFVFSYVADHFQYLAAALAIPVLVAAGVVLTKRFPAGARVLLAGVLLACLGAATRLQARRYENQEVFYRSILERNPASWLAHDNLGVVLVHSGRVEEGIAHYREAIRLNPEYPEAYNNLGNVLAQARQWDAAAQQYALALEARPSFAAAEYNWGNAMSDAGRYYEAQLHFRNALAMDPKYPQLHYALGNALANAGHIDEAIREYEASIALEPGYAEAHANLGLALAQTGNVDRGLSEISRALELRPAYPEAHEYMGLALANAGRFGEALAEYREALRTGPNNPDIHYHMAMVLRSLGKESQAQLEMGLARGALPRH